MKAIGGNFPGRPALETSEMCLDQTRPVNPYGRRIARAFANACLRLDGTHEKAIILAAEWQKGRMAKRASSMGH